MEKQRDNATSGAIIDIRYILRLTLSGVVLLACNLAVTLVVLDYAGLLERPEIVSVNAADMLTGFVVAQDPDISEEDLARRLREMNAGLEEAIDRVARDHNLIVVNSAAVLAGPRDITPQMLAFMGVSQ